MPFLLELRYQFYKHDLNLHGIPFNLDPEMCYPEHIHEFPQSLQKRLE